MRDALAGLLLLVVLVGCGTPGQSPSQSSGYGSNSGIPSHVPDSPASEFARELVVNGIHLGSAASEVEEALGKPEGTEDHPQQTLRLLLYPRIGVKIGLLSDGLVHVIDITAPNPTRTRKGIGIGDSADAVSQAYGKSDRFLYRLSDDTNLMFQIERGRVTRIYLHQE